MKALFLIIPFAILSSAMTYAQSCQLKVKITGIEKKEGDLIVAIFNSEEDFLKKDFKSLNEAVNNRDKVEVCFNSIPSGKYSVSVIHDIDRNGKLNSSVFGPPTEPYGFSNNIKGVFGPPSFEDTSFELKKDQEKILELKLF